MSNMEVVQDAGELDAHRTLLAVLSAAYQPTDLHALMKAITTVMREASGCEAVGIRLRDGEDYPYFETNGLPDEFVRLENSLCPKKCDSGGAIHLDCMCGNILQGRFDATKPFFTPFGSFCSNGTSALLATTTPAERQANTRNRCNGWGYESVMLVPLRMGQNTFGLLQFNDRRIDRFTPKKVGFIEELAGAVAMGLDRQRSVEELARRHRENETMLRELQHRVRNNLQQVASMIRMKQRGLKPGDDAASALASILRRIEALSAVQEQLHQPGVLDRIALGPYVAHLAESLRQVHGDEHGRLQVSVSDVGATLRSDQVVGIGLIVSELVANAFRHAFRGCVPGEVDILAERAIDGKSIALVIQDNGVGMPLRHGEPVDEGTGLRMIRLLAAGNGLSLAWSSDGGTRCEIHIPLGEALS